MFVDTHCHLYDAYFADKKAEIQSRALAAGVTTILLPNISAESIGALDAVEADYPQLKIGRMIGLHPCRVKEDWKDQLDQLEAHFRANPHQYMAVGEIGMDLYWDTTTKAMQAEALNHQLDWAVEWDLPIALHVRSSFKQLFPVLEEAQVRHNGKLRGVFHCFSGGKKQVKRALKLGDFYFGIGGSFSINRSSTDIVLKGIPKERLILETDAPYLTPKAFRGEKNEPSFIIEPAKVMAEVLEMDLYEVAAMTSQNAKQLFGLYA
ncbi:MAG TPA: hydrolase TatD [Cryomorphaceae bacterium]|nr:hydrolase TatD [Cryomorphaceae bacterium]|tara:strand:- start:10152 stop:10943 length:792 start_codon:yes stop_codon:yes gene_type:complete